MKRANGVAAGKNGNYCSIMGALVISSQDLAGKTRRRALII
jgi:hypothetical protein